MKMLKTYEIPRVILIELTGNHWGDALEPIAGYRIHWRYWRMIPTAVSTGNHWGWGKGWGLASSSALYHSEHEAIQAFDDAVARVNSQIVLYGDIATDIMHDPIEVQQEQDNERQQAEFQRARLVRRDARNP